MINAVQVFACGSYLLPFPRTWYHSCSVCYAFLVQSSKYVQLVWTRRQAYDLLFTTLIGVGIAKVRKQDIWVLSFFSRSQILLPTRPWRVRNSINIGKRAAKNQPVFTLILRTSHTGHFLILSGPFLAPFIKSPTVDPLPQIILWLTSPHHLCTTWNVISSIRHSSTTLCTGMSLPLPISINHSIPLFLRFLLITWQYLI